MKDLLEKLKDLLGQLDALKAYYARLSERERYIVLGIGAGGILFVMISIYLGLIGATVSKASKIEKSRDNLKTIQNLREMYSKTERQIRNLEQTMRRTEPGFQLATHLEELAGRYGISIDSLKTRAAPQNDYYQESQVSVSVRQVTLPRLIDLLFEIENSRELLRISSIQVKPNFQDPTQLNATFVVSTFQMTQGL